MRMRKVCLGLVCVAAVMVLGAGIARADAFNDYGPTGSFSLPASSPFDVLNDGRLVTLVGADVYTETAVGSRSFTELGTLTGMDVSNYGAAFIRVSPDGTRLAVGNNGGASWSNYEVGIFNLSDVTGQWFGVGHYDAEWVDNTNLALTAAGPAGPPSVVTALDTSSDPTSPTNPTVVTNIGGYSGGITFDADGNLYTGNAFDSTGPSDTGWIKAFSSASWEPALSGGPAVDFEAEGTLIVDLLSAAALGFDAEGNLHVGGGDLYGGSGDNDYAGLVRSTVVADALIGSGPADPLDPGEVRKFDPNAASPESLYKVNYNDVTGELYLREGGTVYTYVVPEPSMLMLLATGMVIACRSRRPRRT